MIDGTGLLQTKASFSYIKRIGREINRRDFFKIILVIDPDDGLILAHKGVYDNCHESPWFIPLLDDIQLPLDDICSDKGFDSEKNQQYVVVERKANSYVDIRDKPKRGRYRKQTYRKKQQDLNQWNSRHKQMRNCIESKNSCVKHRFGDSITGKNISNRRRYLAIRIFAANLITIGKSRNPLFLIYFIVEDFYNLSRDYCE